MPSPFPGQIIEALATCAEAAAMNPRLEAFGLTTIPLPRRTVEALLRVAAREDTPLGRECRTALAMLDYLDMAQRQPASSPS